MLVDKRQRYFRRYVVRWKGRTAGAPALPFTEAGPNSFVAALRKAERDGRASVKEGKDTIDLIKVTHLASKGVVVLLFHRTSPNAADPAYRKRVKDQLKLRKTAKELDEDQAVSCHFIINTTRTTDGGYNAALEEIPGLSATTVLGIIRRILHDFQYPYTLNKKACTTNTTFKAQGFKSESLDRALKNKSSLDALVLTRTSAPDAPDGAGIVVARSERVRYKIIGDPTSEEWNQKFRDFVNGTKGHWDEVTVEIQLDDERRRTVKLDRDSQAEEIMFVRSEIAYFKDDLDSCSTEVINQIVDKAIEIIGRS